MKTKYLLLMVIVLLAVGSLSARYTSPGWTYGFDLGLALGDNQDDETVGPQLRGNLQFEVLPYFRTKFGLGYTRLNATDIYTNNAVVSDLRLILSPLYDKNFAPYLYGGYGAAVNLTGSMLETVPYYPIGLGMQTKLKEGMMLDVSLGYNLANSDNLDGLPRLTDMNTFTDKRQDGFYTLNFGLMFYDTAKRPVVTPAPAPEPVRPPAPPVVQQRPPAPEPARTPPPDTDGDGLIDVDEDRLYGTDPLKADTDGDGLSDYAEIMTHKTDPLKADTDNDGLNDYAELMTHKTNPLMADTDNDGLMDGAEINTHRTNPLKVDTDEDGLKDGEEVNTYKSNPLSKDTDKGSKEDGAEVAAGTDPLDPADDIMDMRQGARFSLEGILFQTASAEILPESEVILEQAFAALDANPTVKILIIGHTDNVGSAASNLTLSRRRAESVMNWLVNKGISADRIRAEGRGLTEPRATNDTPEGRQLNRRIEFEIVE